MSDIFHFFFKRKIKAHAMNKIAIIIFNIDSSVSYINVEYRLRIGIHRKKHKTPIRNQLLKIFFKSCINASVFIFYILIFNLCFDSTSGLSKSINVGLSGVNNLLSISSSFRIRPFIVFSS